MVSSPEPELPTMTYPFELYRALHRGTEGDVDFYRRVASGASTVLELGAGDGRIARALAADGLKVTALEVSHEAIDLGRAAPHGAEVSWVQGSMERFDLGRRFDRIIAPYNAVYCLTTPDAQRALFDSVARHLAPEGYFVFDAWSAEGFHADADEETEETEPELVDEITVGGRDFRVFEASSWDRAAHFLDVTYTHEPLDGGAPVVTKIPQRYLLVDELTAMLEGAGLELVVIHGAFDQHVYGEESERMIVTAALPSPGA
jgi:SAM-dependent methyltransferase